MHDFLALSIFRIRYVRTDLSSGLLAGLSGGLDMLML